MEKKLTNNFGLKVISLVASIVIWFAVVSLEDPVNTRKFTNIPVTIANAEILTNMGNTYRISEQTKQVTVLVEAKQSVLSELTAEDIKAVADMKNLDVYTRSLIPIEVSIPTAMGNYSAEAVPVNVEIKVEMEATKSFPITPISSGTVRDGYEIGELVADPKHIEISGPESVVNSIAKVVAEVEVSGLSKDKELPAAMTLYDEKGIVLDQTLIHHNLGEEGVSVKVKILHSKDVKVEIDSSSVNAEKGYMITGVTVEPQTIKLIGPSDILEQTESIKIPASALELNGLNQTVEQAIDITQYLPEETKTDDMNAATSVLVKVEVSKVGAKTIEYPVGAINLINVPEGYTVDFGKTRNITIVLHGKDELVDKYEFEQGAVSIDLKGINMEGVYNRGVDVKLDSGITLDEEINVKITVVRKTEE